MIPVIGGALSGGGFILFFSRDSYAGDGPFAREVPGIGGLALSGGLYAAREIALADLWEEMVQSTGAMIAPVAGVLDSTMTITGRGGVNLVVWSPVCSGKVPMLQNDLSSQLIFWQ